MPSPSRDQSTPNVPLKDDVILGGYSIDIADSTDYILKFGSDGLNDMGRVLTTMCKLLANSSQLHAAFQSGAIWAPGDALWGLVRGQEGQSLEEAMSEAVALTTLALARAMQEAEQIFIHHKRHEPEKNYPRIQLRGVLSFGEVLQTTLLSKSEDHPAIRLHNGEALIAAKRLETYLKSTHNGELQTHPNQDQILSRSILSIGIHVPFIEKLQALPLTCGLPYLNIEPAIRVMGKEGASLFMLNPGMEIVLDGELDAQSHILHTPFRPILAPLESEPLKGLEASEYRTCIAHVYVGGDLRGLNHAFLKRPTPQMRTIHLTADLREEVDISGLLQSCFSGKICETDENNAILKQLTTQYRGRELTLHEPKTANDRWHLVFTKVDKMAPRPRILKDGNVIPTSNINLATNPVFLLGGENREQIVAHFSENGTMGVTLILTQVWDDGGYSHERARDILSLDWHIPDPDRDTLFIQLT
ncbi:MAG: hypothetical protein HQL53_04085 [Magnetococcales bacterium]|nr:hypothetical protein [Magnetococcales bacterium]